MAARGTMTESSFAIEALRRCALFAKVDDDTLAPVRRYAADPPLPARRDDLPPGRSGRLAVHHRVGLGQDRPAVARRRGGRDHRHPGPRRLLRRAGAARRRAALRDGRRDRADRDARPAARRVRRSSSTTEPSLRRALLAGARRRAAPADRPRRGAPLPRPARPPGRRLVRLARESRARRHRRGPARLAVHPVRPGRDDRRHAPDGEPAARRPDRPGPRPARARRRSSSPTSSGSPRAAER